MESKTAMFNSCLIANYYLKALKFDFRCDKLIGSLSIRKHHSSAEDFFLLACHTQFFKELVHLAMT